MRIEGQDKNKELQEDTRRQEIKKQTEREDKTKDAGQKLDNRNLTAIDNRGEKQLSQEYKSGQDKQTDKLESRDNIYADGEKQLSEKYEPQDKDDRSRELEQRQLSSIDNKGEKQLDLSIDKPTESEILNENFKQKLSETTGWSQEIIDGIANEEQAKIYKKANLKEAIVDERLCLVKDIDMNYKDPKTGKTNKELMEKGRSPYDAKTGERIELHHIGQEYDSPFAELCENSEHGDGNDTILHDKGKESWRRDINMKKRYNNTDRPQHWKERAKENSKEDV